MSERERDTRAVRASEQLDWSALAAYLQRELGLQGAMAVAQFPGGHSNLTYDVRFGDEEVVLRRPPFGPVPPKAHDMAREFRVLASVHPHFPLAPKPLLLCEDTSVIGSVFYVMERRRGLVIRGAEPEGMTVDRRRTMSGAMIDTLGALHAIDIHETGLDSIGKPAGFVARQIRGWTDRWQGSKTSDVPDMESLAAWLEAHMAPDPPRATLVHGDFKLDNVMWDTKTARIAGVFDWEMAAVGDPLVDLGILLCYWIHALTASDAIPAVTRNEGWFTREEILARYAERTGLEPRGIAVY